MIGDFHWLRPAWLLALIPLALLLWLQYRRKRQGGNWQTVCDPQLLPYILIDQQTKNNLWPLIVFGIAGLLTILALAGPAWKKLQQPVFREQSALVIILDLSRSMNAGDINPSRLIRARHKIIDLLKRRHEGQTALVVYAADAFVVSPLTQDADTVANMVPSLKTSIMPTQGSRADLALQKAAELLTQAGVPRGDVLLITDSIDAGRLEDAMKPLRETGHRLSILGVGTPEGAPIPLPDGGFLKDAEGNIVLPRLDEVALKQQADAGGGLFSPLTTNDADLNAFSELFQRHQLDAQTEAAEFQADQWAEEGPWLLLLVIPLAALAFRRGYLAVLLIFLLPLPRPAQATDWSSLWLNRDQRGVQALDQGNAEHAAELFSDPQWKAAAQYRAGRYQEAAETLRNIDTADAHYNRGNALAQLNRIDEAIAAYDRALEIDPEHEDARFNREQLQQKSQPQEQQNDANSQQDEQNNQPNKDQEAEQPQSPGQDQPVDRPPQDNSSDTDTEQNEQQNSTDSSQATDSDQRDGSPPNETQTNNGEPQNPPTTSQPQDKADQPQNEGDVAALSDDELQDQETQQAVEQWLRRIPDDPGGLLRRKFQYQSRQHQSTNEKQPW